MELRLITIFLITYLVGCFCAAYYLVRWRTGQDIRTLYSGTAGARNAGRVLGKTGFIVSLAIDVLKGVCAVAIARGLLPDDHLAEMIALAGVMLGHVFPVQLGFRGGKGVSVLVGALLVIDPLVLVAVGLAAGLAVAIMRRTTQSTIIAMAVLPVAACWLSDSVATMTGLSLAAVLVLFFHRQNIHDIVSAYRNNKSG